MDINLKYSQNLSETLNVLASKLGVETDKLFVTVKKQSKVEFYLRLLYMVAYVIIFIAGYKGFDYCFPFWESPVPMSDYVTTRITVISVLSGIAVLGSAISFISSIEDTVTLFLNPDYWVLDNLLSKISN